MNIRKTLKKKLFDSPRTINIKAYSSLLPDIFPGKIDFVNFLIENNLGKRIEYAKKIILRMCYESHFPPPNRLILNILDLETQQGADRKVPFAPRDHFVHLVHLYLLGIYLFFYHKGLNACILEQFTLLRREWTGKRPDTLSKLNKFQLTPYEDFVASWKAFVLNHDIGYPWEFFSSSDKYYSFDLPDHIWSFIKPFSNINKSIIKDLAIKALSRLIGLNQLWRFKTDETLFSAELRGSTRWSYRTTGANSSTIMESKQQKALVEYWGDAQRLPRIGGMHTVHATSALIPPNNLVAVLKSVTNKRAVALVFGEPFTLDDTDIDLVLFESANRISCIRRGKLRELAFKEAYNPKNYYWAYYALAPADHYNKYINALFDNEALKYWAAVKHIREATPMTVSMITGDQGFRDYCFYVYLALNERLDFLKTDDTKLSLEVFFESEKTEIDKVKGDIAKTISQAISDDIITYDKNHNIRDVFFDENGQEVLLEDAVKEIFNAVWGNFRGLTKSVINRVGSKIDENIKVDLNIDHIWRRLRNKMNDIAIPNPILNPSKKLSIDLKNLANIQEFKDLDSYLSPIGGIKGVLKSKPKWIPNKKQQFYDHGLSSAMVLACNQHRYRAISDLLKDNPGDQADDGIRLLRMSIGVGLQADDNFLIFECGELLQQVVNAISIHNIYPKDLTDGEKYNFRTKLDKNPFGFFALLCDSLQPWDRKRSINLAFQQLPYGTYGDHFDIQIQGNSIMISEEGDNLKLQERTDSLRNHLNDYLMGGGDLIRLSLAEWK